MEMGKGQLAVAPRQSLKTRQNGQHYRHHPGGQSKLFSMWKILVITKEAALNVKSAFGQIVRLGKMSNKIRSQKNLEQERVWTVGQGRQFRTDIMNQAEMTEPAVTRCKPCRAGLDLTASGNYRKRQHRLLNKIFPVLLSLFLSLTVILFLFQFPPTIHFYWASFTEVIGTRAEEILLPQYPPLNYKQSILPHKPLTWPAYFYFLIICKQSMDGSRGSKVDLVFKPI